MTLQSTERAFCGVKLVNMEKKKDLMQMLGT